MRAAGCKIRCPIFKIPTSLGDLVLAALSIFCSNLQQLYFTLFIKRLLPSYFKFWLVKDWKRYFRFFGGNTFWKRWNIKCDGRIVGNIGRNWNNQNIGEIHLSISQPWIFISNGKIVKFNMKPFQLSFYTSCSQNHRGCIFGPLSHPFTNLREKVVLELSSGSTKTSFKLLNHLRVVVRNLQVVFLTGLV